jgi:catechol 2,3-dioxygenase-like lactoylglutathione lyase family enzyme
MATIRYFVHDVDAAVDFYVSRLGFELAQRPGPPIAMVRRGDLTLWLSGPGTSAARPMPDGAKPVPGGWNRLVLEVDDLDAHAVALRTAGVRLRSDIVSGPGGRQLLIEDPSGNPVELFTPRGN